MMKTGTACVIFGNIDSKVLSDIEKTEATLKVIDYLLDLCFEREDENKNE